MIMMMILVSFRYDDDDDIIRSFRYEMTMIQMSFGYDNDFDTGVF